jgi:hypothetical protein
LDGDGQTTGTTWVKDSADLSALRP